MILLFRTSRKSGECRQSSKWRDFSYFHVCFFIDLSIKKKKNTSENRNSSFLPRKQSLQQEQRICEIFIVNCQPKKGSKFKFQGNSKKINNCFYRHQYYKPYTVLCFFFYEKSKVNEIFLNHVSKNSLFFMKSKVMKIYTLVKRVSLLLYSCTFLDTEDQIIENIY